MRPQQHDQEQDAIAHMIRHASSSWVGPSPNAGQARWAKGERRSGAGRVVRRAATGVAFTALLFLAITAVAAAVTPGGLDSVSKTMTGALVHRQPVTGPGSGAPRPAETPSVAESPGPGPNSPGPAIPGQLASGRPSSAPGSVNDDATDPGAGRLASPSPRSSPSPPAPSPSPSPSATPDH